MKDIKSRAYRILSDFSSVYDFLGDNYSLDKLNSMMIPQFFEYAHTHCNFNKNLTHHMTVWESGEKIVGFCGYEMDIGEAYLIPGKEYMYLLPEMLSVAEKSLSVTNNGVRSLEVWVTSAQTEHIRLLTESGYKPVYSESVNIFRYRNGFADASLPDGFSCINLCGDIDYHKLNRCTWRGFNHGDDVEYDIDEMLYMANGPHHRPELGRIIVAPDGEYAAYAGMWLDEKNRYAYLEPLCTQPEYRKMGLARYALIDSMKQTAELGAEYCFGGDDIFYSVLGFEQVAERQLYKKTL